MKVINKNRSLNKYNMIYQKFGMKPKIAKKQCKSNVIIKRQSPNKIQKNTQNNLLVK